jgi:uncharacterized membrane protein YagU involved in acid resistance
MTTGRALVLGTLAVAVIESTEVMTFWGLRGTPPQQILQYISSGLLGRAAFEGGLATTLLGAALHFFNAFVIFAVYLAASRRFPVLVRRPVVCGLLYGAGVHLFMAYVVIPLSAAPRRGAFNPWLFLHGVLSQALVVGLPCAFVSRAALPAPERPPVPA